MSVYSLFLSAALAAYDTDVDDADYAETATRYVHGQRYNVLYRKVEDIVLDAAATRALSLANYAASEWLYIVLEVVGGVRLATVGVDYDGTTPINGHLPSYGTELFPGKLLLSTYNVSTATLVGLEDDTKIKVLAAIACPDDDARYTENA